MSIKVKIIQPDDNPLWDAYVLKNPRSILYHLSSWQTVIKKTYGHKTYYLIALRENSKLEARNSKQKMSGYLSDINSEINVVGVLPFVHLKSFLFGNSLISIPFFDMGGILADNEQAEKALLEETIKLGQKLKVNNIELRHIEPLHWLDESSKLKAESLKHSSINYELPAISYATKSHKVRMLLELPESSEALMKSFKSKLRSQIKKPLKEGLNSTVGGHELLKDFYKVFSINMRDLGSPVHSKKLIQNVLEEFPDKAKIIVIDKDGQPLACSVIVGFKDTLENPWASALREYSRLSPNMFLYWTMLEYACNQGYKYFDFGRSSPDEGTYKFKEQWGAQPSPLHWHYISLKEEPIDPETSEKSKFEKAIHYWQKLPVPVTKILGPRIRKYIGL